MFKIILKFILLLAPLNSYACVVLLYHHFDTKTPASTSISPKLFEQHLEYIHENNFSVLSVLELVDKLKNKEELPSRCAVITADDAYNSIYTNAYSLLKKYNYPMGIFVSTNGVDKNFNALMSYETMNKMSDLLSFYNHTADHSHLYKLNKRYVKSTILKAEKRLKDELNVHAKLLAYPYGEYDLENYNIVKELGYVAFGQHSGAIGLNSDIYALPRFPMTNRYGNMKSFVTKVNSLPMSVIKEDPISQVALENPPKLKLTLKNKLDLNCFVNGELANINWNGNEATIVSKTKVPLGKVKYNCTSYNRSQKRFHWYSKQWIVSDDYVK